MNIPAKKLIVLFAAAALITGAVYVRDISALRNAALAVHAMPSATPAATADPNAPAKEFHITARQSAFEPGTLQVRKGDMVRLYLASQDVEHGISIPGFNVNLKGHVGQEVSTEFVADKSGQFSFFCNVFCGPGHREMTGTLIVTE